jgi:hypothetical protein
MRQQVFGLLESHPSSRSAENLLRDLFGDSVGVESDSLIEPVLDITRQKSASSKPNDSEHRSATASASTSRKFRGVVSLPAKSPSAV